MNINSVLLVLICLSLPFNIFNRNAMNIKNPFIRKTVNIISELSVVLIVVYIFRSHVYEIFRVSSKSMLPTLLPGDVLVANKYNFVVGRKKISRGDIIVFYYPMNRSKRYIKRVHAVPGDIIYVPSIRFKKNFFLKKLDFKVKEFSSSNYFKVPEGKYFVLGDNEHNSFDSKNWGFVPERCIIGFPKIVLININTPRRSFSKLI